MENIDSLLPLLVGFVMVILASRLKVFKRKRNISGSFKPIPFLNTKAEQNFFVQFNRLLPDQYYLVAKVRLADLCKPENAKNIVAFNKIARKHIDFVLIERSSSKVICCIELDDKSHQRKDSQRRDRDKDYSLREAGITLHRVKIARNYTKTILNIVEKCSVKEIAHQKETNGPNFMVNPLSLNTCPRCKSSDYKTVKMKWPNKGREFQKCNNCTYKSNIS